MLRLSIITDRSILLRRFKSFIEKNPDLSINSLQIAQSKFYFDEHKNFIPDLILIDTKIINTDALIDYLYAIRSNSKLQKIILLCEQNLDDLTKVIFEHNVSGILQTEINEEMFLKAIRAVHAGEYWFSHELIKQAFIFWSNQKFSSRIPQSQNSVITRCEQNIIDLLMRGLTNREIARHLRVSLETVKSHLKAIFFKAGVKNRYQLILFCLDPNFQK